MRKFIDQQYIYRGRIEYLSPKEGRCTATVGPYPYAIGAASVMGYYITHELAWFNKGSTVLHRHVERLDVSGNGDGKWQRFTAKRWS